MRTSWWLFLILLGCNTAQMDDCFTSAGEHSTLRRSVATFDAIRATDRLDIILYQDSTKENGVVVEGPSNLLGQIQTEVIDGVLVIDNHMTCNFVRKMDQEIRIHVNVADLRRIEVESAVNIQCADTLHLNELYLLHQGLSDVQLTVDCQDVFVHSYNAAYTELKGKSDRLRGSIEDASDLDARALEAREVLLDVHSPLDCYIDGKELIYVGIYNSGNIYYKREPTGRKELSAHKGSGQLLLIP